MTAPTPFPSPGHDEAAEMWIHGRFAPTGLRSLDEITPDDIEMWLHDAFISGTVWQAESAGTSEADVRGWVVVDRVTRALDWDGELHLTYAHANASRMEANGDLDSDPDQDGGARAYEVLPVLSGPATQAIESSARLAAFSEALAVDEAGIVLTAWLEHQIEIGSAK